MSILPRYFLRLFLPVFLLCLAVFTGVLMMNHFLKLLNLALMKGISPLWIAASFARLLPFLCSLAVPMAYLVALLLTLAQLSDGGEVMALRASGFAFADITRPFLAVAVALSCLLFYLNHKASPEGFHSFRNRYAQAGRRLARIEVEPRSMLRLGDWRLYAREADNETGRLSGVYLLRQRRANRGMRIDAREGRISLVPGQAAVLELEDGRIFLPSPLPRRQTSGEFRRYRVELPLSGGAAPDRRPDIQEMNSRRLKELVAHPETSQQHKLEYTVEVAVRSAAALSPFVFFWIAAPLGLRIGRGGRAGAFAMSLLVLFAYYGLIALGISLGRQHAGLASAAPWMGDLVGLGLGAFLTRRAVSG